jgi:ABC-type transport system substrate-binding protein
MLPLVLVMVLAVACGGDDKSAGGITAAELQAAIAGIQIPEGLSQADVSKIISDQLAAQPGVSAADMQKAVDSAVSQAVAVAAAASAAMAAQEEPYGMLDVAFPELGTYQNHPAMVSFPQASMQMLAAADGMVGRGLDWEFYGKTATSWEISPDQLTWTFHIREGVQFHDDWGELTAEDWVYSIEQGSKPGSINPRGPEYYRTFYCDECHVKALDRYTLEVNSGKPLWDLVTAFHTPGSDPIWAVSEAQVTELEKSIGLDAANELVVSTGPWKIAENKPGEYWQFDAVLDHYLKTPYFAEMRFWEIPEESTRIANFQTRRLDTFTAVPDSIPILSETPGTLFMSQKGAVEQHLLFYGQYYTSADPSMCPGEPTSNFPPPYPTTEKCPTSGFDPDSPWVSASADMDSAEWIAARKVRLAMHLAIDRHKLINELLHGEAVPLPMQGWSNQSFKPEWVREYDLGRAKELLAEAGYPNGFTMDLVPMLRGAPSEAEACEAIGAMWETLGLDVNIQKIPFNTVVEKQLDYTAKGYVACNASGAFIEPMWLDSKMYMADGGWSPGMNHPITSRLFFDAFNTFDREERWQLSLVAGQLMWDQVLDHGLWTANQIHALGPEVGDWEDHLDTGNPRRISALEWAPHR